MWDSDVLKVVGHSEILREFSIISSSDPSLSH